MFIKLTDYRNEGPLYVRPSSIDAIYPGCPKDKQNPYTLLSIRGDTIAVSESPEEVVAAIVAVNLDAR